MPTITVEQCNQRIRAARAELAALPAEFSDVRIAAITDRGLIPKRDELRTRMRAIEDDIADLEAARAIAQRDEDEAAAAALIDERREACTVALGHIDELVELAGEMEKSVDHLRTLMTRSDTVDAAWRAVVLNLIPSGARVRAFETLGHVNIPDHRDLRVALEEIDMTRSRVTSGDFGSRAAGARMRAEQAPGRIAQALGIAIPSRSET